jgi:NhaC family Na+:H+ antiporter
MTRAVRPDPGPVDLYQHIERQAWTSVPAFVIAFVLVLLPGSFWGRPRPTRAIPVSSSPPSSA